MENSTEKARLFKIAYVFMVILCVFVAAKTLGALSLMDKGAPKERATISLSGHGEVSAVPDIASVSFTISQDAKTVKEAQTVVAEIEAKVLAFLAENNIADKDIKTEYSSFYPKYEYRATSSVCDEYGCNLPNGKNVLVGYTASETITVKIRDVDNAGTITTGLGALKVTNLNGPNFAIDDEDALKAIARREAIDDAEAKAKVLAKDLGVKLVRIVSFNENGSYPTPMYMARDMMGVSASAENTKLTLPKGENTITSDVNIVYEIR